MIMQTNDVNPKLIDLLNDHRRVPVRNLQAAARGRARFLTQAVQLREAASQRKSQRHIGWSLFFRKELPTMKTMISALIVLVLFASATTVFAAQNDLPTDPLYGVKTLSEDAGLWLTMDPAADLERLMELAQLRVQEMTALTEQGETVPEPVVQRLHLHIETALQLAAGQSDEEMQASLQRIQTQLQTQEQTMMQLQDRASADDQPTFEQIRVMTQEQLRLANQGLEDPQEFRNHYRFQNPANIATPTPTLTGIPPVLTTPSPFGNGQGPNSQSTSIPGNSTPGNSSGSDPNSTPAGNGNGEQGGGGGGGNKP